VYRSAIVLCCAITLDKSEAGRTLFTLLNLQFIGFTANGLSNGSLINIFSAILIGLKTL